MNDCAPEWVDECDRAPRGAAMAGCAELRPRPSRCYRRYTVELPALAVSASQSNKRRARKSVPWDDVLPWQYAETGERWCTEKDEVVAAELGVSASSVATARRKRAIKSRRWRGAEGR